MALPTSIGRNKSLGIAAALSGDPKMMQAYRSGDPYLAFAKQAGAVPSNATNSTHKAVRNQFKACVLAVQYGMEARLLGPTDRSAADPCPRTPPPPPRNLPGVLALV